MMSVAGVSWAQLLSLGGDACCCPRAGHHPGLTERRKNCRGPPCGSECLPSYRTSTINNDITKITVYTVLGREQQMSGYDAHRGELISRSRGLKTSPKTSKIKNETLLRETNVNVSKAQFQKLKVAHPGAAWRLQLFMTNVIDIFDSSYYIHG